MCLPRHLLWQAGYGAASAWFAVGRAVLTLIAFCQDLFLVMSCGALLLQYFYGKAVSFCGFPERLKHCMCQGSCGLQVERSV